MRRLFVTAVDEVPAALRDHSSTTVAVKSSRVPEAIERLGQLRAALVELLESDDERDDVYQLEISFFPVTRLKREKGEEEWADR